MVEKQTLLADRDEIMAVAKAIDAADRKQIVALADLCNSVKHKNASVVKATAAAMSQARKARKAMEEMPEIPKPVNISNATNGTNDSATDFLQIDDESETEFGTNDLDDLLLLKHRHHHRHHHRHRHGRHHGHHAHSHHSKLVALNSQNVL